MRRANPFYGFRFGQTFCDGCESEISLDCRRYHCFDCGTDRCESCRPLNGGDQTGHVGAWYPGAPRLGKAERFAAGERMIRQHDQIRTELGARPMGTFAGILRAAMHGDGWKRAFGPEQADRAGQTFDALLALCAMGRFVDFFSRKCLSGSSIDEASYLMSTGIRDTNRWRGIPLFKTAFDCALYPILLAEIRPATIFELGSALGGSALWFADLTRCCGFDCHIYSVDLLPPGATSDRVTFLKGDSHKPAEAFSPTLLKGAPHPWIVIEDAHVNIGGVVEHFSPWMALGDYLIIEDTDAEAALGKYLLKHPGRYLVDTHYTDYFGYNTTCSRDQILCCRADSDSHS